MLPDLLSLRHHVIGYYDMIFAELRSNDVHFNVTPGNETAFRLSFPMIGCAIWFKNFSLRYFRD